MTKLLNNADVTGYISQTSVTSSLLKTDSAGKLVAATAGTDYVAPSALSAYVPYTGATANVDLGTHKLSSADLVVNHVSGSGVAASITKGGSGEALTVIKTSGSGNAASITGGVTLLDELHLNTDLADAYIASAATWNAKQDALTNPVTGTGTTSYLPKFTGTSALGNSLIYDTGSVILIGATTALDNQSKLELVSTGTIGLKIKSSGANGNNTFLSIEASKDWRFLTNRGDLISGNQGDLIIRNNTDAINHIILNQNGSTRFYSSVTAGSFVKSGGLATEILAADGTVITAGTGITISSGTITSTATAGTSARTEQIATATTGSNTITVTGGYTVGLIDVYVNGVKYPPADYTASTGTTVVIPGLVSGDIISIISYTSSITALPTSRDVFEYTATSGQVDFTVSGGYTIGLLDVYVNGTKLTSSEYSMPDTTKFTLTIASVAGNQVQAVRYNSSVTGVSGSGTTNYVPKFTASGTIGNSSIFADSSGNVGIGTATPVAYGGYTSLTIGNSAGSATGLLKFRSTYNSGNGAEIYQNTSGNILFNINSGTGSMQITSGGALLVGGTGDNGAKLQVTGNSTFSALASAVRFSNLNQIANYGVTVVNAANLSSASYNLNTLFPELVNATSGNVWGVFGKLTIFRGGSAETAIFSICRNSSGSWGSGTYATQSTAGTASFAGVSGSGASITLSFNTAIYCLVEITLMTA